MKRATFILWLNLKVCGTANVVSVGVGMSNYTLVEEARKRMKLDNYDEVWCVFDMDFNPERNRLIGTEVRLASSIK